MSDSSDHEAAGQRLLLLRERLGLSPTEFAAKLGMAYRTYLRAEAGGRPLRESEILALSKIGADLHWYLTGEGAPFRGEDDRPNEMQKMFSHIFDRARNKEQGGELDDKRFVLVPRYDIQASAGPGAFADEEQIVDWLAFSRDWVRSTLRVDPRWLVLVTAVGDSMEPTIRAGDLLLVDRSVEFFRDDAIYVIQIAGQLMVKRIQRFFGGAVVVKSDNATAYVEQTLAREEAEAAQVAGRVPWIGRMI